MSELLHAETIQDDINYLKDLRGFGKCKLDSKPIEDFQALLNYAIRIVESSYDERQNAISELEEFLR